MGVPTLQRARTMNTAPPSLGPLTAPPSPPTEPQSILYARPPDPAPPNPPPPPPPDRAQSRHEPATPLTPTPGPAPGPVPTLYPSRLADRRPPTIIPPPPSATIVMFPAVTLAPVSATNRAPAKMVRACRVPGKEMTASACRVTLPPAIRVTGATATAVMFPPARTTMCAVALMVHPPVKLHTSAPPSCTTSELTLVTAPSVTGVTTVQSDVLPGHIDASVTAATAGSTASVSTTTTGTATSPSREGAGVGQPRGVIFRSISVGVEECGGKFSAALLAYSTTASSSGLRSPQWCSNRHLHPTAGVVVNHWSRAIRVCHGSRYPPQRCACKFNSATKTCRHHHVTPVPPGRQNPAGVSPAHAPSTQPCTCRPRRLHPPPLLLCGVVCGGPGRCGHL